MNYYNFCFSPTGGTAKVANAVAKGMGINFKKIDLMKQVENKWLKSDDLCLFAVPAYSGRVPSVVIDRLANVNGNGARAILIAVFGNRAIDDTLIELSDELKKAGFRCIAGLEAVAQHSLLPKYGAGRPDEDDIAELISFGEKIKQALDEDVLSNDVDLPGNRPYRPYKEVPLQPFGVHGCIGCEVCAKQCPVNAISIMDCRNTNSKRCISCMRCVKVCPEHVRKTGGLLTLAATLAMKKACSGRKPNKLYI